MAELEMLSEVEKWTGRDGERFLKDVGIEKGWYVLDFGCGKGRYAIPLAKVVGNKGKVFAFDKDEYSLDEVRMLAKESRLNNIELVKGDTELPLENNIVDAVLCYDMIHYMGDRNLIYSEVYRVLKSGGLFSLYPKHYKKDYPLMELSLLDLEDIIKEVEKAKFVLKGKLDRRCLHDGSYNDCVVLNFSPLEKRSN